MTAGIFENLNTWIGSHQALVVAVGVPILTAISAGAVSYFLNRANLKSQQQDRELQSRMRIFDARLQQLEKLRSAVLRFEKLVFHTSFDATNGLSSGTPNQLSRTIVNRFVEGYIEARIELVLLVDPTDPEVEDLERAISENRPFGSTGNSESKPIKSEQSFLQISRRMIARMASKAEESLTP